tara:strand:- start:1551 stop:2405 length:855 start_codon:yes stop_codon:yes gene_type:complete
LKVLYWLASRFIAGHDFDSAKPKIRRLIDDGYQVSVDYLGELSKTEEDCIAAKEQYIEIIEHYKEEKIDISIKPSQLGLLISPMSCQKHLSQITTLAKQYGQTVRLDMEDSRVTELTTGLAVYLNNKFGNVGVAIQANLHRTKQDLKHLLENNVSVRLVKGAYKESSDISLKSKKKIKSAFFNYAKMFLSNEPNRAAIGTHDKTLLKQVREIAPTKFFDYEFLYGIRRDIQKQLKDKGENVRIYVPFGEDWLPYIIRRLKEWKNLKFVFINVIKELFSPRSSIG